MKLTRSQKREGSFLLMYQSSLNDDAFEEIVAANVSEFEMFLPDETVTETAKAALEYADSADALIGTYSPTRSVARISKIPLTIMRLALYEMNCVSEEDVPDKSAINEAIELCKKYAGETDAKFVSGLLGAYYKSKHNE
ncbi:MAG: transcription antitermination factor NusB [Oscillospiraceae bacterium]|nr:transcription antitermination factor NusB [Oscillospiraceae bacterium]